MQDPRQKHQRGAGLTGDTCSFPCCKTPHNSRNAPGANLAEASHMPRVDTCPHHCHYNGTDRPGGRGGQMQGLPAAPPRLGCSP